MNADPQPCLVINGSGRNCIIKDHPHVLSPLSHPDSHRTGLPEPPGAGVLGGAIFFFDPTPTPTLNCEFIS